MDTHEIVLSMQNICKRYVGIRALDDVSIDFRKGEVHALVGENGAGKSTLIKMISGAEVPDSGKLVFGEQTFEKMTPHLSQSMGVATIYQEFNLFPTLTVAENIYMGDEIVAKDSARLYHKNDYIDRAQKVLDKMNIDVKPTDYVEDMTTAKMQLVEIAKAIAKDARILIMDEPTAPLSTKETEYLFELIEKLKSQGVTIIYISHRLEELYRISDRLTIMRDGKKILTADTQDVSRKDLIRHMANREVEEIDFHSEATIGDTVLEVQNLCGNGLKDISFSVHSGEIFGIGGLLGAGRTESASNAFYEMKGGNTMQEKRTLYLAGKITGDPYYFTKFYNAQKKLEEGGFIVVNPALLPAEGFTWEAYMRMSGAMLAECAEVCFLPDWKESKGAKYEFGEAIAQNKPFFFFADWEREGSQNAEK